MKLKSLITALMALAVGANFAVADEDTPLSKEMASMNKTQRTLKRQVADSSKKAENLELVAKMKANLAASIKLEPAKTKDQPAADKAAYLEKYKKQMADVDKALDDLKATIEKGDAEGSQKIFEKLTDLKEKGHKDFAPDE
jgi:predicted nucleotide-binding protein